MDMDHDQGCGCGSDEHAACWTLPPDFARMRYFYGQRLGVIDLVDEQSYHVGKRRFHNLRAHGAGVLCGLQAERFVFPQSAPPATPTSVLRVRRGAALDGCGRELVVGVDQCVDLDAWFQKNRQRDDVQAWFDPASGREPRVWIALRYRECPTDPAPAPRDPCGCDSQGCEFGRVREGFELALLTDDQRDGVVETFPTRAALRGALAALAGEAQADGDVGDDLERALALLVGSGCPEPDASGWLFLATVRLVFADNPRRVVDVGAPDNAIPERATLLSTAALQALVVEAARGAGTGAPGSGPGLGALGFTGTAADAGTLTLAVSLVDDGGPGGPTPLAAGTFDPSYLVVHEFDASAGTWLPASTAAVSYNPSPARIELVFAAGDIGAGLYRVTLVAPDATPVVDAKLRPLRPARPARHFKLVVDAATSMLTLAPI